MKITKSNPKVSVCVLAYNQDQYIRQCLQSIVDQQADFDFEVIVGDDCSTDGTRAIVQEFANRYPDLIKPMFHEENRGAGPNFLVVQDAAIGEYIAHMDGDDYMLPGKLQTQADFLDEHSEVNIVWHRMRFLNESTGVYIDDLIDINKLPKAGFFREDILRFMAVGVNSSKMYRSVFRKFETPNFPLIDYFVNVQQVDKGRACFVGEVPLGVYRVGIGISSSGLATHISLQKSLLHFSKKYPEHKREISGAAIVLFAASLKNKSWRKCALYGRVVITTFRLNSLVDLWKNRELIYMFKIPKSIR